ncbi:MAG: hypothetical protein D6784_00380 [Chloroflexi bacterium]|nr:MAG: hypothetical protein D6784_00380 [Chloroflexota bacterium]
MHLRKPYGHQSRSQNVKTGGEKMSDNGKADLTPQQAQVIAHLVAGMSQAEAARQVGVAAETISRWKANNPAFVAAYNQAKQAQWDAVTMKLDGLANLAVDTLADLLQDDDPKVRLQAVRLWLEHRQRPEGPTDPQEVQAEMEHRRMGAFLKRVSAAM